ncbi:cytochrome c oxidase subunit 3, partial (mitochondrion) [Saccharomycopsis crataegensis]
MSFALSFAFTMHGYIGNLYVLGLSMVVVLFNIIAEATFLGDHTMAVRKGLNLGFMLFVLSEMLIFAAIFW